MKKCILMIIGLLVFSFIPFTGHAQKTLKLATTTSAYETGLLEYLFSVFEKEHYIKIHIISTGTGKAIRLAEAGDVDVILVHARDAEDLFVKEGHGVNRREVMFDDFLIMGPENDPAKIRGLTKASQALSLIAKSQQLFVSRGDDSGTHKKEKKLWSQSGLVPRGNWYLETGQGMAATLRIADEKNTYVLVGRSTYLFHRDQLRLKVMVEGDPLLLNPYGVIAVSPYQHPQAQYELAMILIGWMTSPECQTMIADYKIKGAPLFHPNAANPIQ